MPDPDPAPADIPPDSPEGRVLLLAPSRRDAAAAAGLFAAAGLPLTPCDDLAALSAEIRRGAAVAIVPEEAVHGDRDDCLAAVLADQPPWSDFPLIVLTLPHPTPAAAAERLDRVGPMTLVRRPVEVRVLLSTVRAALRDRRRQYARRADLAERDRQAAALRDADRRKDEFLAMLAHELRNPLAAVNNAVAVLNGTDDAESRAWAGGVVERQVQQLVHLIDDLLDIARITSGKVRLRPEPVDARVVVNLAVESARPAIDERRHALRVAVADEPLPLNVDVMRLEQVVLNLLTNAAKYTDPGGHIAVDAFREGDRVVLRVRDDGAGIPPDRLPEMFRLFAQGDRSLARSEGGLGIGLTIVQSLVELHGGTVEARSEGPGRGSEFTIRLPRAARPAAAPAPTATPAAPATPPSRASRVLVVDDNVDTARGLARLLTMHGHAVESAHDGPAALEAARAFCPEVVLLDIGLPGLDGYEVARRLRGAGGLDPAPIIVAVSGYGQEDDRRRSREAGFDHHLVKPINFPALLALIG